MVTMGHKMFMLLGLSEEDPQVSGNKLSQTIKEFRKEEEIGKQFSGVVTRDFQWPGTNVSKITAWVWKLP